MSETVKDSGEDYRFNKLKDDIVNLSASLNDVKGDYFNTKAGELENYHGEESITIKDMIKKPLIE